MKAITIQQPWAHLIAAGIKDIENRTWKTKFRGTVFIHASAKMAKTKVGWELLTSEQFESLTIDEKIKYLDRKYDTSAIIGQVDIKDCVQGHHSKWAEINDFTTEKPIWNWVLKNAELYKKPILDVKGALSFWEYRDLKECNCCTDREVDEEFDICENCGNEFCVSCQAPYDRFSQIDFSLCTNCYNNNYDDGY